MQSATNGLKPNQYLYAVPVTEPKKGETAVYRHPEYTEALLEYPDENTKTFKDLFLNAVKENADSDFIGRRLPKDDGTLEDHYTWETYAEIKDLATHVGSGMVNLGLTSPKSQYKNYTINFVSIYAKNTREWFLTDLANTLYGFTTMPIYDTLGEEATDHMFNETELLTCFLTSNHVEGVSKRAAMGNVPHLKNLVVFDPENLTGELRSTAEKAGLRVITFPELVENGRQNQQPYRNVTPDDVTFFSYTSGTTGKPKGAMITHRGIVAATIAGITRIPVGKGDCEAVHISYLPLAHIFERMMFSFMVRVGGKVGLFNGNVLKLKEDLAILKPTIFASVPRLYNKFYDKIKAQFDAATGMKACLANQALSTKLANEEATGSSTHWFWDWLVFGKTKAVLGGNCQVMVTASAPISLDVMRFLKVAFCCPMLQGYGQTEGLGGSFVASAEDGEMSGHVGGPLPHNEFKLIDVPDMNYFSTDKDEQGRLAPRGEVLVRGPSIIPDYYKQEAKTREAIDEDGWLHSGDIAIVEPGTHALRIIDRRKNIFKLSQGEYVAPDKLENFYKTVKGVGDIMVYGDSLKSVLVAIVVVDQDEVKNLAAEVGKEGLSAEDLCKEGAVNKIFMERMLECVKVNKLKGFEKIKKVHLEHKEFKDNGLTTATFKLKRSVAKEFYKPVIDKMYEGLY